MKTILLVCTGNTCRSAMAEGIMRSVLVEKGIPESEYVVKSAGLAAVDGDRASGNAVLALEGYGIDIKEHKAKMVNRELLKEADLALAMTRGHKDRIIRAFPEFSEKVFTLKEYANAAGVDRDFYDYDFSLDIQDPFGMNLEEYRRCSQEIHMSILKIVERFF